MGAIGAGTAWIPIKKDRIDSITVQPLPNGRERYAIEIESAIDYPIENAVELHTNLIGTSLAVSTNLNTSTKHESAKLDLSTSPGPGFNSFYCHKDFAYTACVVGVVGSNFTYDIQNIDIHGNKHTVCKGNRTLEHSNCTMFYCSWSGAGYYSMSASGNGTIEYNMSYDIIDVDLLITKCVITFVKRACQLNNHQKTHIACILQGDLSARGNVSLLFKKMVWFLALLVIGLGFIFIILPATIMLILLIKYRISPCRSNQMLHPEQVTNETEPLLN